MKVMDLCLDAYNDDEAEMILNGLVKMYMTYRKKKEERTGNTMKNE